jgi:hypothetical protein
MNTRWLVGLLLLSLACHKSHGREDGGAGSKDAEIAGVAVDGGTPDVPVNSGADARVLPGGADAGGGAVLADGAAETSGMSAMDSGPAPDEGAIALDAPVDAPVDAPLGTALDAAVDGTGGTGGTGGAPARGASVLERNKNPSRDGHFVDARLTRANAARMVLDPSFKANFTGDMFASPLYLENGPGGKGVFFAVTTGNDVFALDEVTGAVVWKANVGKAAPANGVGCGGIHPLGIIATPVIDAQTRTIYVSAAVGADTIERDEVHALNVDDGTERAGWPVNVSQTLGFDPRPHNPRSALSLVNGILYVAYGGHNGDCGDYHGRVVAIDTRAPTKVAGWATAGMGEAIWASGGMASDGDGVIASTGNRTGPNGPHQDSEEVVRITGMATLSDVFYPTRWQQMDATDADFASSNPVVLEVPGATPSRLVAAVAKDGHLFFLDAHKFGGLGGELIDHAVANTPMAVWTSPTAYTTAQGSYVALTVNAGALCPGGSPSSDVIVGVRVAPGAPPTAQTAWCTSAFGRSPISSTLDGRGEPLVWFMAGLYLRAVDGDTGANVLTSQDVCSGTRPWTSPIAVKGRIIVGADNHLCAWVAP